MNTESSDSLFPLPERIGAYGNRIAFANSRKESGQWVFWEDRVDHILAGRYDQVVPLHVELSPTYMCNYDCSWCNCRAARALTPITSMDRDAMFHVLEELAALGIGVMWTGGEPLLYPFLIEATLRAQALHLAQCLFTNGSLLNERLIDGLFGSKLAFVRISLNAISQETHRQFHGYRSNLIDVKSVIKNLHLLLAQRARSRAATQIGLSIVLDDRNCSEVESVVRFIEDLSAKHGHGSIDYLIARPAFSIHSSAVSHHAHGAERSLSRLPEDFRLRLSGAGTHLILPDNKNMTIEFDGTESPPCLGSNLFGAVTPRGDLEFCSDRYGDPHFTVCNLLEESLTSVRAVRQRQRVKELTMVNACLRNFCPRSGRGFHYNAIFNAIEAQRRNGNIFVVRKWIEDLRKVLPRPAHSFFL